MTAFILIGLIAAAFLIWLIKSEKPEPDDTEEHLAPEAEASPHSRPAIPTLEDQFTIGE